MIDLMVRFNGNVMLLYMALYDDMNMHSHEWFITSIDPSESLCLFMHWMCISFMLNIL